MIDWMVITTIGLIGFLMWHIMYDKTMTDSMEYAMSVPNDKAKVKIEKAATIYGEPGLSGKIVDPLSTTRNTPSESEAWSTIAMPFA